MLSLIGYQKDNEPDHKSKETEEFHKDPTLPVCMDPRKFDAIMLRKNCDCNLESGR